jgi:hypothetical protein
MARKDEIPKNMEIWAGSPYGLRLRKHPLLEQALEYLDEYPMVIRKGQIIDKSALKKGDLPQINLGTIPAFRKSSVGLTVELRVEIDCPPADTTKSFARMRFKTADSELEEHSIVISGKRQVFCFPFPEILQETEMTVELQLRDGAKTEAVFTLKPEKKLTIYTAFQTHLDLGWTDRAAKVIESLKKMTANVAIKVCGQFADNPPGQRFVWTCECSEALRLAWEGSNEEEKKELKKCLEQGLIQCSTLPYSFHSSIMSKDLMNRAVADSMRLKQEIGVENICGLSVAQQHDVMGHSWVLPDVLAENGIKQAVLGHNHMVRGSQLPPLFRWRGPEGGEVITLSTTCCDYGGNHKIPASPDDLYGLSSNNPDHTELPGTALFAVIGYGENCGPESAANEMNAIKTWHDQFEWPKVHIGGAQDYFAHIEKEVDIQSLPVIDREISDWWVDGPASSPMAVAQYRKAMRLLPELAPQAQSPTELELVRKIEHLLILYAEHTFGMNAQLVKVKAAERDWDISSGFEDYVGSWEDKDEYASTALESAYELQKILASDNIAEQATGNQKWEIETDEQGIKSLKSPNGNCWFKRCKNNSDGFASIIQRLVPQDLGEWFHHDPPCAPNAGTRNMQIKELTETEDGILISGFLDSPAGNIPGIEIELKNDNEDLIINVNLKDKSATAQSEALAISLSLFTENPEYSIDAAGSMLKIDQDQLVDANRDAHSAFNGWIVKDNDRSLAVSSAEIYLWHFGEFRYCNFNRENIPRNGKVYAHLFNNLWETNFRGWIGGDLSYSIRLRDVSGLDGQSELDQMSKLW